MSEHISTIKAHMKQQNSTRPIRLPCARSLCNILVVIGLAQGLAGCAARVAPPASPTGVVPGYSPAMCLNNTQNDPVCKDCCDALDTDAAGRKTCRDACAVHDFSVNASFITITVVSTQGPKGDYSACTQTGAQSECKVCCDSPGAILNGDRRFCRDACNLMTDDHAAGKQPPGQPASGQKPPAPKSTPSVAALQPVTGTYQFTEGPVADTQGNVYFSDITAGRIYKWSTNGEVRLFVEGLSIPNGLAFASDGVLIACEGGNGRLISIDAQGKVTPLIERYNGTRFNEPNDLWIDPQGGIYFTDPVYQLTRAQDGEDVYYLTPDRSQVTRVITDMVRPNGIVGAPDGKTLYVADHGAGKTYAYAIQDAGVLTGKRLFAASGSDGMTLDKAGNIYLTTDAGVQVYDPAGKPVQTIKIPEPPTNVEFGGADGNTLFITARSRVYTLAQ